MNTKTQSDAMAIASDALFKREASYTYVHLVWIGLVILYAAVARWVNRGIN